MSIRVLLVDDQELMRIGFRMVIESQPDLLVVGEAPDGRRARLTTRRFGDPIIVTILNGDDRGQCRLSLLFAGPQPRFVSSPLQRPPRPSSLSNGF